MPREYHENGAKETPTPWYYSLETTFYEFVSRSAHRTLDPKEADFFFAPTAAACFQIAYNSPSPRHWAEALPVPSRAFGVFSFWESLWRDDISTRIRDPVIANARAKRGYNRTTLCNRAGCAPPRIVAGPRDGAAPREHRAPTAGG